MGPQSSERPDGPAAISPGEQLYRLMVENALDVFYLISKDGRLLYLSPAFEQVTGWAPADWIGREFLLLIHPDDREKAQKRFRRMLAGEMVAPAVIRAFSKSGDLLTFEFKTAPFKIEGKIGGVSGAARDITARKQNEERLAQQSEFLEKVLDSLPHPFYVLDPNNYEIKMANAAAAPGGLPAGTTCHALTHREPLPCKGSEHFCPLDAVRRTKKPVTVEHVHYSPEGEPRNVEVHSYPIFDRAGNVSLVLEYSLDITERKRAEEVLRNARDELERKVRERTADLLNANEVLRAEIAERKRILEELRINEEKYRELVQNANSIILRMDTAGRVTFFNEFAQNFFGYSEHEILGSSVVGTIVPPTESSGRDLAAMIRDIVANPDRYVRNENENIRKNGERVWVYWTNKALLNEWGGLEGVLCIGGDISERKKAEEALREAESLAAMGKALSGAAHDMKTPLVAIGGFTRLVRNHLDERSPDRGLLDIVIKETQRLEKMTGEMLDFSKPLELDRSLVDVNALLAEVEAILENTASKYKVTLQVQGFPDIPPVFADGERLKQALINLVTNAVQASPEGGVVTVRSGWTGSDLVVEVSDSGCGIPPELRKKVFVPFVTTKKEGTGLGLPIVKKIVEAHHGRIGLEENPDGGVTFRLSIPARPQS